jgi:hypothetical protein
MGDRQGPMKSSPPNGRSLGNVAATLAPCNLQLLSQLGLWLFISAPFVCTVSDKRELSRCFYLTELVDHLVYCIIPSASEQ